jgi:hypothetical protein
MIPFVVFLFVNGCGGQSSNPTAPTPTPSVTPTLTTDVSVTSPNSSIGLGTTEQMTAIANLSNGTTDANPIGTWSSSAPGVATVDSRGLMTTVGVGGVSIYFDMGGGSRNGKGITVNPEFEGRWSGDSVVTRCTSSGSYLAMHFCRDFLPVGTTVPYTLDMTQTGFASVTATPVLGTFDFEPSTASIAGSQVALTTNYWGESTTVTGPWTVSQPGVSRIAGTIKHTWTDAFYAGQADVQYAISTSSKSLLR